MQEWLEGVINEVCAERKKDPFEISESLTLVFDSSSKDEDPCKNGWKSKHAPGKKSERRNRLKDQNLFCGSPTLPAKSKTHGRMTEKRVIIEGCSERERRTRLKYQ